MQHFFGGEGEGRAGRRPQPVYSPVEAEARARSVWLFPVGTEELKGVYMPPLETIVRSAGGSSGTAAPIIAEWQDPRWKKKTNVSATCICCATAALKVPFLHLIRHKSRHDSNRKADRSSVSTVFTLCSTACRRKESRRPTCARKRLRRATGHNNGRRFSRVSLPPPSPSPLH